MFFRKLRCSFCRRTDDEVAKLVAGARGYICDRCATEVMRIVNDVPTVISRKSQVVSPAAVSPAADLKRTWYFRDWRLVTCD